MSSRAWWILGAAAVVGFLTMGFLFLGMVASLVLGEDASTTLGPPIGIVNLIGEIDDSRELVDELERHRSDDRIRAVVLRIDSPGGGVAASQEIHDEVMRLRHEKPVVVSMGNVAASGGYYVAVAADSIVANPGTLTGSIGVILSYLTGEELLKKIGVRLQVYKSGAVKDIGTFHREPTPEERALLEGVVNDSYDQFVEAVTKGRHLSREAVLKLADGRIFTGRQALEVGLVDELGGQREAVRIAARMAGIKGEPRLVSKARHRFRMTDMFRDLTSDMGTPLKGPRLEYRFR